METVTALTAKLSTLPGAKKSRGYVSCCVVAKGFNRMCELFACFHHVLQVHVMRMLKGLGVEGFSGFGHHSS